MVRNVVLVTVDSLRADHVGDRADRPTAPTFDALSEEGVVFEEAVANASSTPSSFPTILTGTYPLMYGGYRSLSDERPFLARNLSAGGVVTAGFHSNPHLGANRNYDAGFDAFSDTAEGSESVATLKDRVERLLDPDSRLYALLRRLYHYFSMATDTAAYARADTVTDDALAWLDEREDGPFFLWVHYMDVHYPFQPPDDCVEAVGAEPLDARRVADLNGRMQENPESLSAADVEDLLALYDGEIRFTDREVGRLVDGLRERGAYEDTAVVLTADHGEAFGEHDRFGHHPYLYDELLRVPLLVHVPGADARRVDRQVSLVDLPPTVHDLLSVPPDGAYQGESLAGHLDGDGGGSDAFADAVEDDGEDLGGPVALATAGHGDMLATRTSSWKCFWRVADGAVELYDLREDPDEAVDVGADNPDVVERFRGRMEAYLEAAETTDVDLPDPETDDAARERLRDLGYVE